MFDAGEAFDRAGFVLHRFPALAQQVAVEKSVNKRGFPRSRDAGHAGEDAEGKIRIEFLDVVQGGAAEFEKLLRFAAFGRDGNAASAEQVIGGERSGRIGDEPRRTAEHELSAGLALSGSDVGEPVGRADDRFLVFDDEQGVSVVAQAAHDGKKLSEVARMESDAGFVHDEERVDQRSAETGGEIDALDFAAGKRAGRAIEREVTEPDFVEVRQTRGDLVEQKLRGVVIRSQLHTFEKRVQLADG